MHFARYNESQFESGKELPADWVEEFTKVLSHAYKEQSETDNSFFHIWGQIYDKEILVIISYLDHANNLTAPKTLFISHDLVDDTKKLKATMDDIINFSALVFDDIFSKSDWNDYFSTWTENKFNQSNFHYKITRENISLTLQAEQILSGKLPQ